MMFGREFNNLKPTGNKDAVVSNGCCIGALSDSRIECGSDVFRFAYIVQQWLDPQSERYPLHLIPLRRDAGVAQVVNHRHSRDFWNDLSYTLDTFGAELVDEGAQASDVSPRLGEATDHSGPYRFANRRHNDWNSGGGVFGGKCRWRSSRHEDVYFQADQLDRKFREALDTTFARAIFNDEVLALDIAEPPHLAPEGIDVGCVECFRRGLQHADAPDLASLLRQRTKGPRDHRAGYGSDEIPPAHSTLHPWPDEIFFQILAE